MKLGFWEYVKAAFSARPIGMFVPPNWIGVGAFGLLGLLNPGFWLVGAGLELAYLYTLVKNPRFRRTVEAGRLDESQQQWKERLQSLVRELGRGDRSRYRALERRCRSVIEGQELTDAGPELAAQSKGLGRLMWIFLRLLMTRDSLRRVLPESGPPELPGSESVPEKIERIQKRLDDETLNEGLRKSLSGQVEILNQRVEKQEEARHKMEYLEAELTRIEQQVELIREQAVVAGSPEAVSRRIDQISATLGGTTEWIREQRELVGGVEDLLVEPQLVELPTEREEA